MMRRVIATLLAVLCASSVNNGHSQTPAKLSNHGQRAFDLLGAMYQHKSLDAEDRVAAACREAVKEMMGQDAGKSRVAADFLVAMLQQLIADEINGRSEWQAT